MGCAANIRGLLVSVACLTAFASIVPHLYGRPRPETKPGMQVVLPWFVQVLMAGGDRYLAADLAGFRALVVSTNNMSEASYSVLGKVQADVAWLNPAHEDNYYIAAAILPWNGQVDAAQFILKKATIARPNDPLPPFYYGFNALFFQKNAAEGGEWMRIAASHARDEMDKISYQQMAANWIARGGDVNQSISLLRKMADETQHKGFANFLEKRISRLENFSKINAAVALYNDRNGKYPSELMLLVRDGFLDAVPKDPFGGDYCLDESGKAAMQKFVQKDSRRNEAH